jgi:uncharacterized protein YlaI
MSETILCGRCSKRLAMEDAEEVLTESSARPWETPDETNAPVYVLWCPECAAAKGGQQ